MRTIATLSSFARASLYGGIGNETPSGVEYDELARRTKKSRVLKPKIALPAVDQIDAEPIVPEPEPAVLIPQ